MFKENRSRALREEVGKVESGSCSLREATSEHLNLEFRNCKYQEQMPKTNKDHMTWAKVDRACLWSKTPPLLQCYSPTVNLLELKHNPVRRSKKTPHSTEYMIRIVTLLSPSLPDGNKSRFLLPNGNGS